MNASIVHSTLRAMVVAFVVSVAWEFAHAPLYITYQGGEITSWILLRAAFGDVIILLALAGISGAIKKDAQWCNVLAGMVLAAMVAFNLELYALATERWAYALAMPRVPY